jgi:hypothetical protein
MSLPTKPHCGWETTSLGTTVGSYTTFPIDTSIRRRTIWYAEWEHERPGARSVKYDRYDTRSVKCELPIGSSAVARKHQEDGTNVGSYHPDRRLAA